MENTALREQKILDLKKNLAAKYVYIMHVILFCYVLYFGLYLKNDFMFFYISGGLVILSLTWFLIRNRFPIEQMAAGYMIVAPLFSFTIILFFWDFTVTNFVWLIPVPIGAYIFFSSKEVIVYSLYSIMIIIAAAIVSNYINIPVIDASRDKIRASDIFLFVSNIIVAAHLLSYQAKISSLKLISELEKQEKIQLPVSLDKKENEQYKSLFHKIESLMQDKQVFKNPDFNISTLSTMLKVSNSYISRAIRNQDYSNFNNYLNYYRIEYVVSLIHTTNLEKVTMLYIYIVKQVIRINPLSIRLLKN